MSELHQDIVTAVMDCIEQERMISRGKLEQVVAGVIATRKAAGAEIAAAWQKSFIQEYASKWNTVGDPTPRHGLDSRNPLMASLKERGHIRQSFMGAEFYVDPATLKETPSGLEGVAYPVDAPQLESLPPWPRMPGLPPINFNHTASDKPLVKFGEVDSDSDVILSAAFAPSLAVANTCNVKDCPICTAAKKV